MCVRKLSLRLVIFGKRDDIDLSTHIFKKTRIFYHACELSKRKRKNSYTREVVIYANNKQHRFIFIYNHTRSCVIEKLSQRLSLTLRSNLLTRKPPSNRDVLRTRTPSRFFIFRNNTLFTFFPRKISSSKFFLSKKSALLLLIIYRCLLRAERVRSLFLFQDIIYLNHFQKIFH